MSNYNKSISYKSWWKTKYFTRKDWRHKNRWTYSRGSWKDLKHITNIKIRNYQGDMQNGGWYRLFCDPWCWD